MLPLSCASTRGVEVGGAGGVAFRQRLVGRLQQVLFLAADAVLGDALDEGGHLALRQRAEKAVDRLAVDEGEHRRDRLDAELPGDRGVLVDIHLDQLHLALGGPDHLFEHRGELLARAAPLRPEIHQHRLALGFLDHVLDEGLGGRVLDRAVRGCGRAPLCNIVILLRPSSALSGRQARPPPTASVVAARSGPRRNRP